MTTEKPKVKFQKLKESEVIPDNRVVKITKMQHIIEILSVAKPCNNLQKFRKLDKFRYIELETGEILEYQLSENRSDNIASVKRSQKSIRNLINNNFIGGNNELFITLTYRPNVDGSPMNDTKKLYRDFEVFWKRFKRKYTNVDYMSIVEPQGNRAWHCHVLIRRNSGESIYIANNSVLAPMWEHGFTKVKRPNKIDNIGAYFSAYLADLEVCDDNKDALVELCLVEGKQFNMVEKEIEDDNGNIQKKKFLKGARLHLYPSGMNLYRFSDGIVKPETEEMTYEETKKIVGSRKANYTRTINLSGIDISGDQKYLNSITYEQYNLKRD